MKSRFIIITLGVLSAGILGFGIGTYYGAARAMSEVNSVVRGATTEALDTSKEYGLDKAKALRDKYLPAKAQ